jgi:hypothetical protein
LATTLPVQEFTVEAFGRDWPAGQAVKKPKYPLGTTVDDRPH